MIHRCNTTRVPASRWGLLAFAALLGATVRAQGPTVTLTPSNFNGHNISCFGVADGAIDASVSGGTAPYTYVWTNSETTQDIGGLAAGYYKLIVTDAGSLTGEAEITLTEPRSMKLAVEPFVYPNRYHISCHECYNGSIDLEVSGGVTPYAYLWRDDATTQDRSALGAGTYAVVVTDANGCTQGSEKIGLRQPERSDWTMNGNEGTDPSEHFIGTSDEQDVVFKSNATEILRLKSDGGISLLGSIGQGVLYRDGDGTLRGGGFPTLDPLPDPHCHLLDAYPFWETRGNSFNQLCPQEVPLLGTLNDLPLRIVTDAQQRMIITTEGKVGIGTEPPVASAYRLFVEDGIATRDVMVKLGDWPDYVFQKDYHLLSLAELKDHLDTYGHLPGIPSAAEVEEKGGVELGDLQKRMLETIEQQALYILQLEERMKGMEHRLENLEATK